MSSSNSPWTEHKMPDGRVYYFNKQTKQSVWEKPDELKTPGELILSRCEWRAHKTPEGKLYYYNTQTKATSWTKPLVRNTMLYDYAVCFFHDNFSIILRVYKPQNICIAI